MKPRARLWAAGLAGLVTTTPCATSAAPLRQASAAGVTFEWRVEGEHLSGCLQAPTTGWVAVGFNTRPALDGARLVMGRVAGGHAHAEVHRADPPRHEARRAADGEPLLSHVSGAPSSAGTRLCFRMALRAGFAGDVSLRAEQATHLILAWSHEADFQHHSARREALEVML
jgi:hypothetical protein